MNPLKVLFAGTAGVRKSTALENLRLAVERLYPIDKNPKVCTPDGRIPILDDQLYGPEPLAFLDQPQDLQKRQWRETFNKIRGQFHRAQTEHHFLGLHLTYRDQQIPRCIASFPDLIDWNPDLIVTFIDDVYCARERIHSGKYRAFTLAELLTWRSEEVLVGDLLARTINAKSPPPNYVVAIRHSPEMLARLLLKSSVRVYTSYNIRKTRNDPILRGVIDRFRQRFREQEHCAVFDPLAIDELPFASSLPNKSKRRLYDPAKNPNHRWPVSRQLSSVLAGDDDLRRQYPLRIPTQELRDITVAVDAQIKPRDFRLIEQSHYLVVYRPTIKGLSTGSGVQREIAYAQDIGRPIIWYINNSEDPPFHSPFLPKDPDASPNFFHQPTEKEFWKRIVALKPNPKFDPFLF